MRTWDISAPETASMFPDILTIGAIHAAYAAGASPADLVEDVIRRRAAWPDRAVFITPTPDDALRSDARDLMKRDPGGLPLYGIPFAVKDNIDVAGHPTTAACPAFAYMPERDATVVARLKAAGAIVIGKTNLDQFATGLNGSRSPYGAPRSVFDPDHVSGGSSSGSAVAVAAGICAFSLGTDTAGSGRVPAAFNNIVGVKPTPGLVPNTGVVPACRSIDVVSVFGATVADAVAVRRIIEGHDAADPYSRTETARGIPPAPRIGVLTGDEREFYGNAEVEALYDSAIARAERLGATILPFDYAPFRQAAALLYNGPWLAERLAAVGDFMATNAGDLDPTVRQIIEGARGLSAVDAFRGQYELNRLRQLAAAIWDQVDMLMLPTSPTTATLAAMQANPVTENSKFGRYTNFANLMGCAAIAVPAGFGPSGLPAGIMLVAPGFTDDALAGFAARMHADAAAGLGHDRDAAAPALPAPQIPDGWITLAVVGAHLRGMPLNHQLTAAGGIFLSEARTAPVYRLHALDVTPPRKPGLRRIQSSETGASIELELWALSPDAFASFVHAIPAPLGIGKIVLEDGRDVSGFICEGCALRDAEDISHHGGWRAYLRDVAAKSARTGV